MYSFSARAEGTIDVVEERVVDALKGEGFGVLTEIDVQATLKAKLGVERRPYKILGACIPSLANKAIEADPNIGLLLPCNVVLREEDDGGITVAFMDPVAVLQLVEMSAVAELARDVKQRLERVRDVVEDGGRDAGAD